MARACSALNANLRGLEGRRTSVIYREVSHTEKTIRKRSAQLHEAHCSETSPATRDSTLPRRAEAAGRRGPVPGGHLRSSSALCEARRVRTHTSEARQPHVGSAGTTDTPGHTNSCVSDTTRSGRAGRRHEEGNRAEPSRPRSRGKGGGETRDFAGAFTPSGAPGSVRPGPARTRPRGARPTGAWPAGARRRAGVGDAGRAAGGRAAEAAAGGSPG